MGPLDLLIIVAYLAAVVAAGAWFGRRQKTTSRYFLAGGNVPWWAIAASIVATETSTITFISVPGIAFARGGDFRFLQLVFGYLLGRVVIVVLFIPSYFRGDLVTVYELLQTRFGNRVKALAASLFMTTRTIGDGIRLLLTAIVLGAVYGAFHAGAHIGAAIQASVLLIGVVMIVFTFLGGMEAVVWIEVVQLGIYIAGAIAAAVILSMKIPGGMATVASAGEQFHKFRVFDFTFDVTRSYTFWSGLIGGCFLTMSTHGTDQYLVQRYLCTSSPRRAATALLTSGAVILAQFIGFLFIGVMLFAFYGPSAQFAASDQVFPDFITRHMPSGLSGLVVAANFAAAMSSSLNSVAATFVADLYAPVVKGRDDAHYLRVSHVVTIIAGVLQIAVALLMHSQRRSALDAALSVASLINGPILGVFLLGSLRRGESRSAFIGMSVGLLVALSVWMFTKVAWPWYAVIGSMTTVLAGSLAAAVTERA